MLTANLALDNSTGTESTFNLQAYLPDGARRIDTASTLTEPRTLEIKHTASGKGAAVVDRHLIAAVSQQADAAGIPYRATVNLTIAVPRNAVFSNTDVADLISYVVDFISDGGFSGSGIAGTTNLLAVLRGES
jgi:hypothetical protein